MKISIEQSLRALQRFLAGEWRLALPVALAFLAVPPLAITLVAGPYMRAVPPTIEGMRALGLNLPGWMLPLMIVAGLVTVLGALSLMALVLLPRISVGEAIATAARRLPVWIGACLIVGAALFALLIVVGLLVGSLPSGASLLVVVTLVAMVLASLYLILVMPLLVDRGLGPVAALREGFTFYRGQIARIVAGMILFVAGAWIVAMALQVALGSIVLLIARAIGQAEIGQLLVILLGAFVSAVEWGSFYLLVAILYRQRAGRA